MLAQDNDSTENEVWKDIPEYEGLYQVSNLGRVKSLKRKHVTADKIRSFCNDKDGYQQVNLSRGGVCKTVKIHKLVMLAFVGERPDGLEINHKDGIKTNNHLSNLEYCTLLENIHHAIDTGLRDSLGEENGMSKLTESQVLEIRTRYKAGGTSHRKLAQEYGVGYTTIGYIINRKTWGHLK